MKKRSPTIVVEIDRSSAVLIPAEPALSISKGSAWRSAGGWRGLAFISYRRDGLHAKMTRMSSAEIIAESPRLSPTELSLVQAKT